ncbi:MAG: YveK family protein [Syntrophorhabdaceae bacterium]
MDEIRSEQYEPDINLIDLLKIILKHKKLITYIVIISVLCTAAISLLMTKIYESRAMITPVEAPAAQSGMAAIAAQFGVMTPQSSNVSEIVGLLKSNILMQKVMEKGKFYDIFFDKDDLKGKTDNEKLWKAIRLLKEDILKITENKKENIITISAQYKDPVVAQKIASITLTELTEYMTTEAKRVAEANKVNLDSQMVTTADPFVRQKIYALIAQQIETSMMAAAKENFAFKIIDPPMVPDKKSKPKRTVMVLISFVVSLFLGILLAFAKEHSQKNGTEWQELINISGLNRLPWMKSHNKENHR